jgi:hypothetical protein
MLLAIIVAKNQIWSDSAAIWQAVIMLLLHQDRTHHDGNNQELFIRNGSVMMETIESMWYYLSQSLKPLLWINLLALSLFFIGGTKTKTWTHTRTVKSKQNPNTADAMTLREDE